MGSSSVNRGTRSIFIRTSFTAQTGTGRARGSWHAFTCATRPRGRKRLLPDPWLAVVDGLNPGDVVDGKVTNVVDLAPLCKWGTGWRMVHISGMPEGAHSAAALLPGSLVQVRVLRIDPQRHRIGLSLRGLVEPQAVPVWQASC